MLILVRLQNVDTDSHPCLDCHYEKRNDGEWDGTEWEPVETKTCETCKYFEDNCDDRYCSDETDKWEPKVTKQVTNTNLKGSSMKEQKIYDVTVVERIEDLHEASGVIQGINRKVLVDEKFSAVTEKSAEQKALKKCDPDVDVDSLEITCRPFPG